MKKIVCLFTLITFAHIANAQKNDSLKIRAGLMFAPQAGITTKDPEKGFSGSYPLFAVMSFTKGGVTLIPFYTLNTNYIGTAIEYAVTEKFGTYVIWNKSVFDSGQYIGFGFDTPVANDNAFAFIEVGTDLKGSGALFFIGAFIPLKFEIK